MSDGALNDGALDGGALDDKGPRPPHDAAGGAPHTGSGTDRPSMTQALSVSSLVAWVVSSDTASAVSSAVSTSASSAAST